MRTFLLFLLLAFQLPLSAQLPYVEDFGQVSGNGLPTGWSTADLSTNTDALLWRRCDEPTACAPYTTAFTTETQFAAPGAANGYVTVDSDAHGDQPEDFESVLQSPSIDCESADTVYLSFYTFIASALVPPSESALVEVRADGGDWTAFYPFCTLQYEDDNQRSRNPQRVVIDISPIAAQAAAVDVRWRWTGDWEYSWSIDDVLLSRSDPRATGVVWGGAPGEGDFANGPGDWTVNTLAASGPDEGWRYLEDGYLGNAFFATDNRHIQSPTVCNGLMLLNADFYSTGGDTPIDPPYPAYVSELISPVIDLSDTDGTLTLEWYESVRVFQAVGGYPAPTLLSLSTDGGQTWSAPMDLHPELQQSESFEGARSFPLPAALSGTEQARLKFIFAAEFFWWGIDDVRIRRRPAHDLALIEQFTALPASVVVPASQVDSIYFLTDLRNNGGEAATNVQLNVRVSDVISETTLHRDSLPVGEVPADTLFTNLFLASPFTPPAVPGLYELSYRVGGDSLDARPQDNVVRRRFQITDTTFAKERGRTRAIAPSGSTVQYAYGNCFYLPRGAGWYGSSISFGLANAADVAGETLLINLLEWEGDLDGNDMADIDLEYRPVGINAYTVSGGEELQLITVPLLSPEGTEIALRDDTYYLATVEYSGATPCFFQASEAYDYTATYVLSDSLGSPRYASVLKTDFGTDAYDLVGFGLDVVPVVRLNISDTPTSSTEADTVTRSWSVFPNPASRTLHWQADLPPGAYTLRLIDVHGRTVLHRTAVATTGRLRLPVLPGGTYLLSLRGPNGEQLTQRIMIGR